MHLVLGGRFVFIFIFGRGEESELCFVALAVTAVKNAVRALEVLGLTGADNSPRRTKVRFLLWSSIDCHRSVNILL